MITSCLPYPTPRRVELVSSALVSLPTHLLCAIFNSWTLALISSSTKEASAVHYFHHIRWGLFCCACWGWKSRCTYNRRRLSLPLRIKWIQSFLRLSEHEFTWVQIFTFLLPFALGSGCHTVATKREADKKYKNVPPKEEALYMKRITGRLAQISVFMSFSTD